MYRTIDVLVHDDGTLELLEPLGVRGTRRAILTILNDGTDPHGAGDQQVNAMTEILSGLRAEGLLSLPADRPQSVRPLTRAEREALAQQIPDGTPLSQIIVEDRADRF